MIFEFYPWKIDVNVDKTKELYSHSNYSLDQKNNNLFIDRLTENQIIFFHTLGVDPMKIKVRVEDSDLLKLKADGKVLNLMSIEFLICGKFLAIPSDKMELYGSVELFENEIKEQIQTIDNYGEDRLFTHDVDGLGIRFRHPVVLFEGNEFWNWNCGYVCRTAFVAY